MMGDIKEKDVKLKKEMSIDGEIVTPGDRLGEVDQFRSGQGSYALDEYIYASVVGIKQIQQTNSREKPIIQVLKEKQSSLVPQISNTVTAKVTKVNERVASVEILCVGNSLLKETFPGTIRKRDVRKFEVDSVEMYKSFRPGDIVRADVISLGDSRSYYLSTAKNELGVILAQSTAGHTMVPISWEHMLCPVTQAKEYRKVAKV